MSLGKIYMDFINSNIRQFTATQLDSRNLHMDSISKPKLKHTFLN